MKKKVLLAMSGGVDSSVAAKLLIDQGYEVVGVFLNFWKERGKVNIASSQESLLDAKKVAKFLGIKLLVLDYARDFKKAVVDNFLEEYAKGNTPNPCVVCNRNIKIGKLLEYAQEKGFNYLVTGHYVKIRKSKGKLAMFRAKDKLKDQSYFLYTFNQKELGRLLFPLGKYTKEEVKRLAKKYKLGVESKAESQDICFLSGPHNNFLKRHLSLKSGPIILQDNGEVVGEHKGLPLYTIGQRRGIEIGGTGPYYVSGYDYQKNILYVVKNWNENILYGDKLMAINVNWLSSSSPEMPLKCQAVIRYGHKAVSCIVNVKNKKKREYKVNFIKPQRAITPGQSVVFYQGNKVLGGGIIL